MNVSLFPAERRTLIHSIAGLPPPIVMPYRGRRPVLGTGVFIAPATAVIGDVVLGDDANVWFECVLRGDEHYVRSGRRTNVQDGTVIHLTEPDFPAVIGARVTIGHGAIVHGCMIEDAALIDIGATIIEGAIVESGAIIAAGAVVTPGKRFPSGQVCAGCPAKFEREVRPGEEQMIRDVPEEYCARAAEYMSAPGA